MLAAYLIQSGSFFHPISRRELARDECEALDAYLAAHRLMQRLSRGQATLPLRHPPTPPRRGRGP